MSALDNETFGWCALGVCGGKSSIMVVQACESITHFDASTREDVLQGRNRGLPGSRLDPCDH